ncbi:hypothetical protein HYU21_04895, partial [Candidatus Woesearchaeota archaeon]|nr:hypothetical protein [Candidatus Woesearchaeota archaeon]
MFSKLKEKLKGALSIFSKKAEEEAVEVKTPVQETKTLIPENYQKVELKVHSKTEPSTNEKKIDKKVEEK